MGSSKAKALLSIAKLVIALGFGYWIYATWLDIRVLNSSHPDPEYYPQAAGVICTLLVYVMLGKINKGSGE